jgi:hypothetical protein
MAIAANLFFVIIFTLGVQRYGHFVQFRELSPDYFLILGVFYFSRGPHAHLILVSAFCGWMSDILSYHPWSLDACFFVLSHLFLDRLNLLKWGGRFFPHLVYVAILGALHVIWLHWINSPKPLEVLHLQTALNLLVTSLLFFIFTTLKAGWGLKPSADPYRILNA